MPMIRVSDSAKDFVERYRRALVKFHKSIGNAAVAEMIAHSSEDHVVQDALSRALQQVMHELERKAP